MEISRALSVQTMSGPPTVWGVAALAKESRGAASGGAAVPPLLRVGLAETHAVAAPITTEVRDLADVPAGAATLLGRTAGGVGAARGEGDHDHKGEHGVAAPARHLLKL